MAETLTDRVYEHLLEKFLHNRIPAGSLLDRKAIAKELNVSVGTVLLALNQLEHEGFVETLPRKGTLVRAITIDDAYGYLLIREALECTGARLYCGEKVVAHDAELMEMAKKLDVSSPQFEETIQLDILFHTSLVELTGIKSFINHYRKIIHISIFHAHHFMVPNITVEILDRHVTLVQSLKTTDKEIAEEAVRRHVRQGKLFGNL